MATSVQQNVAEYVGIFTSYNFDANQAGRVIITRKIFIGYRQFINIVQITLRVRQGILFPRPWLRSTEPSPSVRASSELLIAAAHRAPMVRTLAPATLTIPGGALSPLMHATTVSAGLVARLFDIVASVAVVEHL